MGYCKQTALPAAEPVLLDEAKVFLRIPSNYTAEDQLIIDLIQAAREQGEIITGRALAQRTFVQVMDGFPDSLYRYAIDGEALWATGAYNLPWGAGGHHHNRQNIRLSYPPAISIQNITYVDTTGNPQTLTQDTDFILDRQTDWARLRPLPGAYWPFTMCTANVIAINFTAGYDPSPGATSTHTVTGITPPDQQTSSVIVSGVPQNVRTAIKNLVAFWYQNRGVESVPDSIYAIFRSFAVYQF